MKHIRINSFSRIQCPPHLVNDLYGIRNQVCLWWMLNLTVLSPNLHPKPHITANHLVRLFYQKAIHPFVGFTRDVQLSLTLKFRTRYSGHLLARLAEFGCGVTKQTIIPTTWRESLKEQTNLVSTGGVWASKVSTILFLEVERWMHMLSQVYDSCLVRFHHGLKGRLACLGPNYRCTCLTGYTDLG